ncbi:Glu-tRNAGln amidotransferase C subunit [Trinorchestia longiramus]|nr:Glu-tRNAGln amidotransferase C subunit [Trinorchestia longiramus]
MLLRCKSTLNPVITHSNLLQIYFKRISVATGGSSAVPLVPSKSAPPHQPATEPVTLHLVRLLEKLSLVDVANAEGVRSLNYTISMADRLRSVDTTGITPLVSLLEDRSLKLGEDRTEVQEESDRKRDSILACASDTLEEFYVVSPGNISYEPDTYPQDLKTAFKTT